MYRSLDSWLPVLLLVSATLALLASLRFYQVRAAPEPEMVRKIFHLAGGLLGITLVWLFTDLMPVLILALFVTSLFIMFRFVPALRAGPGQVLLAVQRDTVGEFCYVASFVLLFWLAKGNKLLYSVPLVVLAVADTFAALIGSQYGKLRLSAQKSAKTLEGAFSFFIGAFFCVHIPLLLWSDTPRLESLLIALNVSVMVMMAEAAAWWGLDNLIIPLTCYLLLSQFLGMAAPELTVHLAVLLTLSLIILSWRKHTTLADDALFGSCLWGYVLWVMGGWHWVLPALILFVAYDTIAGPSPFRGRRVFGFPVVLSHIAAGLVWLLFYAITGEASYFYPFTAAFASNLAITTLVRYSYAYPVASRARLVVLSAMKGAVVTVPAILLFDGLNTIALINLLSSVVAIIFAEVLFLSVQPRIFSYPTDSARWFRQAAVTFVASAVSLLPHWILVETLILTALAY